MAKYNDHVLHTQCDTSWSMKPAKHFSFNHGAQIRTSSRKISRKPLRTIKENDWICTHSLCICIDQSMIHCGWRRHPICFHRLQALNRLFESPWLPIHIHKCGISYYIWQQSLFFHLLQCLFHLAPPFLLSQRINHNVVRCRSRWAATRLHLRVKTDLIWIE